MNKTTFDLSRIARAIFLAVQWDAYSARPGHHHYRNVHEWLIAVNLCSRRAFTPIGE